MFSSLCWQSTAAIVVLLPGALAYTIPPPTTAPADTISDCTNWAVATSSDTCATLAADGVITLDQLYSYNPSLKAACAIIVGDSYCIEEDFGIPPATTSTTTTSSSTTSGGNGISTPSPVQTGISSICNKFYLVQPGDSCSSIATQYGIGIANFYAWNPAVGTSCLNLDYGYEVCVGVIGFTASVTATTSTTTTPTNGISTPQPIQTGMVSNCDLFYLVQSGDSCNPIAMAYGISLATFYAWNPAIGTSCSFLDVGDYVCVGIVGQTVTITTSTTTTSSTPTNGISTPTPIQTGLVSNCNSFYLVQSGDSCAVVTAKYGISLTQFYAWNPAVGTSCSFLDVGDWVCVNIIGGTTATPTTTSTTLSTSTTSGNGIATPTPIEPGMVTNCNKFHFVVSGDSCASIAAAAGISLANFYVWNTMVGSTCSDLWLSAYVCIGII